MTPEDFEKAVAELFPEAAWSLKERQIGFNLTSATETGERPDGGASSP